jgi:hypothetical protein
LPILVKPSNIEPFSFSAIASSPDCRRDSSPPVGVLTLAIDSAFARLFFRIRDEAGAFSPLGPLV